jgi:CheY-like chemotaxis protein
MNEKKIIIVEDELFLRDLYSTLLQQSGYTIVAAIDGEAGVQLVKNNLDADLVLLDIMLPKKHGVDVLKMLKADPATQHIPVIILSNLTEESVINETLKLGATAYLVKVQVSPEQLIQKVKKYLDTGQIR